MIGLVTDSSSQIPAELVRRYGVRVVPIIVSVDGEEFEEGVDLDADGFFARFRPGATEVSTSQPSPGTFRQIYEALVAEGCSEILSIHVGSAFSGTVNSARLGAADLPVHVVDTGTLSFGVTAALWSAAEALRSRGVVADAIAAAETTGARAVTAFILSGLEVVRAGGRLAIDVEPSGGVAVFGGRGGELAVVGEADALEDLGEMMASTLLGAGDQLRVGVCLADAATLPMTEWLERRLRSEPAVVELVRYRVGPSVAAHTGPGTAGGFAVPINVTATAR